jgi:hypothetical protein
MHSSPSSSGNQPISNTVLAALTVLGSTIIGLCAGIFARLAGGLSLYHATGAGALAGVTTLTVTIGVLAFARSSS